MKNKEIREAAKNAGVCLWQVAEAYGISEVTFSRRMRKEFTPEEKQKIMGIIDRLSREKKEAV